MSTAYAPFLVERLGRFTLLHIIGELDIGNYLEFSDALERAGRTSSGPVIVAFLECTYVDTSGLTALVRGHRAFGRRLHVVVAPDSQVHRLFEITGLHRVLQLHKDFRVALAEASFDAKVLTQN